MPLKIANWLRPGEKEWNIHPEPLVTLLPVPEPHPLPQQTLCCDEKPP